MLFRIRFEPVVGQSDVWRRTLLLPNQDTADTAEVRIPPTVYPAWDQADIIAIHQRPRNAVVELGRRLLDLALGESGLEALHEARLQGNVRIVFEETPAAGGSAAVPWELLHDGEDFLALNPRIAILRQPADLPAVDSLSTHRPLRVLVIWAAPGDQSRLDIEMEQIRLSLALAPYKQSGQILDFEVMRGSEAKLREALAARSFDIVYFTGHGTFRDGNGYLCLETPEGRTAELGASAFARLLAAQHEPPALVFLNCCLSAAAGDHALPDRFLDVGRRVLAEGVPFVLATLTPVYVSAARQFMEAFLGTLLKNDDFDVPRAAALARAALFNDPSLPAEQCQSFYQYLLLSSAAANWTHRIEIDPEIAAPDSAYLYASAEKPQLHGTEVRRNDILGAVERAFQSGERVVGLYGVGGLGKTVASVQVEQWFCRHVDPGLRCQQALWLELRSDPSAGSLITQLADCLEMEGEQPQAYALRDQAEFRSVPLARQLARTLGANCLLTLDNCESALDEQGDFHDAALRDLITALAGHTGWRCLLTSREPFALIREGRELCPIHWQAIGDLGFSERATLLRVGFSAKQLGFEQLPEAVQRRLIDEVAVHPYELKLFLHELARHSEIDALIDEVHHQTGRYARLDYYLGRVNTNGGRLLGLLAVLDEPTGTDLLNALWQYLARQHAWSEGAVHGLLADLIERGLVERRDDEHYLLPVLRHHLLRESVPHALATEQTEHLHRDIAAFFGALTEQCLKELKTSGLDAGKARTLTTAHIELAERALRHSLEQHELNTTWPLLQQLSQAVAGRIPPARMLSYTKRFTTQVAEQEKRSPPSAELVPAWGVLGSTLAKLRRWEMALSCFQRCDHWARQLDQTQYLGVTYHQMGMVYQLQRDWKPALEHYQQALEWKKNTGQHHEIGGTYHQMGMVYQLQRDWKPALEHYQQALEWMKNTGQHHEIGGTYHQMGMVYQLQRDWKPALEHYQQALEWKKNTGQHHEIGGTYHQMGMVYQLQRDWKPALEHYQQALEWMKNTGQHHEIGGTYHQMGMVYQLQRDWKPALEHYQQALEWMKNTGQHHEIGVTYHQMGMVYEEQRDWKPALEHYQQALEWMKNTGQHHEIGGTYHQMGMVYQLQRDWKPALEHYQQALEWKKNTGQHHEIGGTYHQMGMVYQLQRDWKPALEHYQQALEWMKNTGQHHEIGVTYHQIGRVYEEQGNMEQAAHNCHLALESLLDHDDPNLAIALRSAMGICESKDAATAASLVHALQDYLDELVRKNEPIAKIAQQIRSGDSENGG